MKPKAQNEHEDGLLEYLEDIIGTSQYKEQIEALSTQLETLNDERGTKMTRMRIAEKDKNALEVIIMI
jgi:structural maintenance of chromosome 4